MSAEETAAEGDAGSSLLLNQPVVIDNGTSTLKAGFAGSSKPKVSAHYCHCVPVFDSVFPVIER